MKSKILENLFQERDDFIDSGKQSALSVEKKIAKELEKSWDDSTLIQQEFTNAESASMYQGEEDGIYSWYRAKCLDLIEEREREFFESYASDRGISRIDWENDCLLISQGDDNYRIQSDSRHDNGVWQSGKLVIDESEYKENGDVDEEKLAYLIEQLMEKSGYFPGAFEVSYHGDVSYFETINRAKAYKARPIQEESDND